MKENKSISVPINGMSRDIATSKLQNTQYGVAVNINSSNEQGDTYTIQLEPSNHLGVIFPDTYKVVGYKTDILKERTYYFLTSTTDDTDSEDYKRSSFGYTDNNDVYNVNYNNIENLNANEDCDECGNKAYDELGEPLENIIQTPSLTYVELFNDKCLSVYAGLNLDINFPIKKIEINKEKLGTTIYWNDYNNPPRYLNITDLEDNGNENYLLEVEEACEDSTYGTCIDIDKLLIFPKYNRMVLEPSEQQLGGNLKMGSYEFRGAYCDLAGNEMTQYSTPTNPIDIFDENNNVQAQTETDEYTNFAIKLKVSNLDTSHFKYYKIAVIERNNVLNSQSVFLAGIYPTTDDTVIYSSSASADDDLYITRGNTSLKRRMDFNTLNSIKPNWEKAKFTMVSGDTLWHGGLVQEEEINVQPVLNLFSSLLHWQTAAASENLYKSSIATSKYKGYTRNEVQTYGLRLIYDNGGYSATHLMVARPSISGETDEITDNINLNSLESNTSSCTTTDRNKKWQLYNTAFAYTDTCYDLEGDNAITITEDASTTCKTYDIYTIPAGSATISLDNTFTNLEDYIDDYPSDSSISVITDAISAEYEGSCSPTFTGDCTLPATLDDTYNEIGTISNEVVSYNAKDESDYYTSVSPTYCSPYKLQDSSTSYEVDTDFTYNYMGCTDGVANDVYYRDSYFYNETCGYATELPSQEDVTQAGTGIFLNYAGASLESDLLQDDYDVAVTSSVFKSKLHSKAQFFTVTKNSRDAVLLEFTKATTCTDVGDSLQQVSALRYTLYTSCSEKTVLGGGIVDLTSGSLTTLDTSSYPSKFIVAIDSPMIEYTVNAECSTGEEEVTNYIVTPPCGCFSAYIRDVEYDSLKVTWDSITLNKVQKYTTECTYNIPSVSECDPIAYKKGVTAYWESTESYNDNKELWDSSDIKIKEEDLTYLSDKDKEEFLEYHTNGEDSSGNYILKSADLRCQPIRHYKMPDNTVAPFMIDSSTFKDGMESIIFPLGVNLDANVVKTVVSIAYNNNLITEKQRDSIVGFEILRGDNTVSKSIIANGIAFDYYNYEKDDETINYSNFPFNDLGENKFLLDEEGGSYIQHPYDSEKNHMFSFLSPDVFLSRPSLPTEVSLQGFVLGKSYSSVTAVDEHSKWVVLADKSTDTATSLAILEFALEVAIKTAEFVTQGGTGNSWIIAGVSTGTNGIGVGISAAAIVVYVAATVAQGVTQIGKYRYDWLRTFRDLGTVENFANFQTGVAKYNRFVKIDQYSDNYVRRLAVKKHLKEGDYAITDENTGKIIKVNNWLREHSVFLSTGEDYPFTYSDYPEYMEYDNNKKNDYGSTYTSSEENCKLGTEATRNAGSPYFSLKNYIADQWGSADSIKWLTTNSIIDLDSNTDCTPIFGGTSVISRFSWRRKTPIFRKNAVNLADKLPFIYSDNENIGFPKYYCDYETGSTWTKSGIPFPDIKSEVVFDCTSGESSFYYKSPSKFYLFVHGIVDFLVESEINCNFRHARKDPKDWFYPQYQNLDTWLQEDNLPMVEPNTFFYNNTYSTGVSNSPYKAFDSTYNKEEWRKRNLQNNAVTWSQKDINENDTMNPWLVYKPLDWYEFKTDNGLLIDLHNIESNQFIARFENRLLLHNAIDTFSEKLTPQNRETGVAGMFYKRPVEFKSTDLGFMGTQHTDIVSTPYGHFWVDAKRGRIFKLDQNGQGLEVISEKSGNKDTNMKQWFREHLPMKILKDYPNIDVDNKYKGIGFNMWYDDRESRLFITKRDYRLKKKDCIEYDETVGFYYSCEEEITCPDGYTYNTESKMCEKVTTSDNICQDGYVYDGVNNTCTLVEVADATCTEYVKKIPISGVSSTSPATSFSTSLTPSQVKCESEANSYCYVEYRNIYVDSEDYTVGQNLYALSGGEYYASTFSGYLIMDIVSVSGGCTGTGVIVDDDTSILKVEDGVVTSVTNYNSINC